MIFLRREARGNGSPPVQADLSLTEHGNRIYIRIRAKDGLDISLGAARQDLRTAGLEVIPKFQGIIRGDAEPKAEEFNLITIDDLNGLSIPQKLELLIKRFSHSRIDELDPDLSLVDALKADYKAVTGREYRANNGNQSQAAASPSDLELIKPILPEILDGEGKPAWGAQQRIAEALGLPGTGGSHRRRILEVLKRVTK